VNSDSEPTLESLWCVGFRLIEIILRHYLKMGDLSIIVSHSFVSLMLFVYLHTV
jgi:hypothetical protein